IYFLLEYYKHTNNILIKEQIFNLTQKYIKSNPKNEYFGFAHGIAGEIFVLNQVRKILPDKNIDVFLESKLNELLLNLDRKNYNWKISENSDTLPLNWCHGSPGILLIYPEFRDKYNWPINNILMKIVDNRSSNLCLCHGLIGN
ncbi:TPA: hypothetical protein O1V09_002802, partial [Staphylococcus aureus]|nr:hypothetical protein [Staphylococcus aureus]